MTTIFRSYSAFHRCACYFSGKKCHTKWCWSALWWRDKMLRRKYSREKQLNFKIADSEILSQDNRFKFLEIVFAISLLAVFSFHPPFNYPLYSYLHIWICCFLSVNFPTHHIEPFKIYSTKTHCDVSVVKYFLFCGYPSL